MDGIRKNIIDHVGILELNLNEENTLTDKSVKDIIEGCKEMDKSKSVRVILLKSAHKKFFCNGFNLKYLASGNIMSLYNSIMEMVDELYALEKIMVASINGYAMAGGAVLGILADYRLMGEDARYSFNEIKLGLPLGLKLLNILKQTVGSFHAKHLSQLSVIVRSKEALEIGLADRIYSNVELDQKSFYFAKRIASLDSVALRYNKHILHREIIHEYEKYRKEESKFFMDKIFSSKTLQENIKKLASKYYT